MKIIGMCFCVGVVFLVLIFVGVVEVQLKNLDWVQYCVVLEGVSVLVDVIGLLIGGMVVKLVMLVQGLFILGFVGEFCWVIVVVQLLLIDVVIGILLIQFNLNFFSDWNGKVVYMGGGGYNGMVVSGMLWVLYVCGMLLFVKGYVIFVLDFGYIGLSISVDFVSNDVVLLNFVYEYIKKIYDVVFVLIQQYYGKVLLWFYFVGVFIGGCEGLMVVQCYFQDYDGVYVNVFVIYFWGMWLIGLKLGQ